MTAESAAFAEFTFYFQATLVAQQYVLDDSESQAGTPAGAGTPGIHPVKTLRQPGYMVWRNAAA